MCKSTLITQTTQWRRQQQKPLKNHLKLSDFPLFRPCSRLGKVKAIPLCHAYTYMACLCDCCGNVWLDFCIITKAIDAGWLPPMREHSKMKLILVGFGLVWSGLDVRPVVVLCAAVATAALMTYIIIIGPCILVDLMRCLGHNTLTHK